MEGVLFPHNAQVKECLAPLTALTLLALCMQPADHGVFQAFADSAACMPRLQHASLNFWSPFKGSGSAGDTPVPGPKRDWLQGLLSLPSWGRFELDVYCTDLPDSDVLPVIPELDARGAKVSFSNDMVQMSFTSSKPIFESCTGARYGRDIPV
eukprot:jgi/Ulvmu1/4946/UM205_0008.1